MINIIVYTFLIVWAVLFIYIGLPDLNIMLGGGTGFYLSLPLVASVVFKSKKLFGLSCAFILTLIGLILINYLYSYFLYNNLVIPIIALIYIIIIPIGIIWFGFVYLIQYFLLLKRSDAKTEEDKEYISNFSMFIVATFVYQLPIICSVLIFFSHSAEANNINSLGYLVALTCSLFGSLLLLYKVSKIPEGTRCYFSKQPYSFNGNIHKFKKSAVISIFVFLVFSTFWEISYRGHWLIWAESVIVVIIFVTLLSRLINILFTPFSSSSRRPIQIHLPSIKDKTSIIMGFLALASSFLLLIIDTILRR